MRYEHQTHTSFPFSVCIHVRDATLVLELDTHDRFLLSVFKKRRNESMMMMLLLGLLLLVLLDHPVHGLSSMNLMEQQHIFADTLTAVLYNDTNDFTSCLGVSMAFGLIYPSSIGPSREQMEDVFGYDEYFEDGETPTNKVLVWDETAANLQSVYNGADYSLFGQTVQEPLLSIANSVWVRDTVQLNETYAGILGDLVRPHDFDAETAGDIINAWVDNSTNGLIDSIVKEGPLDPTWVLVAINSLYLKAAWANPFFESFTGEDTFYTNVLRDTPTANKAHFMHMLEKAEYSASALPGFKVLRLRFNGGNALSQGLSMIFVLPMATDFTAVTSQQVVDKLPDLESRQVAMAVPRFSLESEYSDSLKEALQAIGLVAPFKDDLCVLQNSCEANVDYVIQKTVLDVHEDGIEAAAVTAIAVSETTSVGEPDNQAVRFQCDHQFQIFIHDANENAVLFEGSVGDPGIPQDAKPAPFQGQHAEENFWKTYFGVDIVDPTSEYSVEPFATTQSPPEGTETTQDPPGNDNTEDPLATVETFQGDTSKSRPNAATSVTHFVLLALLVAIGLFL